MIKFAPITDADEWNNLTENHPEGNFLQSWQWGEAHRLTGHAVERIAIHRDGLPVGCFQAIVREAKRGRYIEIPGGPLVDWSDNTIVQSMTDEIKMIARRQRAVFVRIRPQTEKAHGIVANMKQFNWRPAPMHLHAEHTSIVDLTIDPDTLLKNMRQQTRYEVRRVVKRGIHIEWSSSLAAVREFHKLQTNTATRQHFIPSSLTFLEACQQVFGDSLRVYYAKKDDQLLNMSIAIFYGNEADYFEAASTLTARKEPGAYGIIWRIIEDAQALGLTRLNLWGIASSDSPSHRYAGVTTFKKGFGGTTMHYLPAHDLIINPLTYPLNWTVETIRRKRRKL
ncbi:MAG TPA: peptidoglycan bridge formation glycyltransferase FemA/FemB family protein [Candidatus Saccharibacteria bacterium]|nr:peptidoglycan bridge formation glycyltransferase FemA/FemB family protein [Candidatus Saccharibacteria bacterium]HMR38659.1 peptidoglycan bridge formation glycyltransferase FemA/FemB family protein [Candidatus Saccharibacteria bacterium]